MAFEQQKKDISFFFSRLCKQLHSRPQSPSFLGHVVLKRGCTGSLQIKPSGFGDENEITHKFPLNSFREKLCGYLLIRYIEYLALLTNPLNSYDVPASNFAASSTEGRRRGRLVFLAQFYRIKWKDKR